MIILLGFPKSGTTSFHELFKKLGFKSYHWVKRNRYIGIIIRNNKLNSLPLLNGFKANECITQMDVCISPERCYWPNITDFKQIYFENKDSVFILNKRNPEKLLQSMKAFKGNHSESMIERMYKYNPELVSINKTDDGFIDLVKKHYTNVEEFFKSQPESKFIVYDIEKDNIDKLTTYIDIKGLTRLPHLNKNAKNISPEILNSNT